jgi:predicted metal-dependent phosphoesterase TrpH
MAEKYSRGIIHCHSYHSYDSVISIATYLRLAKQYQLDFIILTDHNTTAGARELSRAAAKEMPTLEVPLAAEYSTDEGDVIVVFVEEEIMTTRYRELLVVAKTQHALLMLPHPYAFHNNPEMLASDCDLVEVFNSRVSQSKNDQAQRLANSATKPSYVASDAHLARHLPYGIMELEDLGDLRTSLLLGDRKWVSTVRSSKYETGISQLIKAWKRRDAALAARLVMGGARALLARSVR